MDRAQLPLNALRAFEAAARHLNITRAAAELCVSQGAVSQQVSLLEDRLGVALFRRLPRGLALTDEGLGLVGVVEESFDRIGKTLDLYREGRMRQVLTVGVVGTFAQGWLLRRTESFGKMHPDIDLRIMTNNNRVDLAGEGLDYAIRFGDGAWHGVHAEPIMAAPLSPVCAASIAARLTDPSDLAAETFLRSYRADEWPRWFTMAGLDVPTLRGPVFDSSNLMVTAAEAGLGVALVPTRMFLNELMAERLAQPFEIEIDVGGYWLTRLKSRPLSDAMSRFAAWMFAELSDEVDYRTGGSEGSCSDSFRVVAEGG
jgi:LysR family transcriptional regulator of beta-lactamase